MTPHAGSVTEPSFAPNSTSIFANVSTSNAPCAAVEVGASMLRLTEEPVAETAMSVGSKDGPS